MAAVDVPAPVVAAALPILRTRHLPPCASYATLRTTAATACRGTALAREELQLAVTELTLQMHGLHD